MATRTILTLLALSLLVAPALAKDDKDEKKAEPAVKEATAKEAKHELKIFERDFDTADIDFKIDAVLRFAKCVHKTVMERLLKIVFKEKDPFIRAEALLGLGNQVPYKDKFAKKLKRLFDEKQLDPMILTALVKTLGKLKHTKYWEEIAKLTEHWDDDLVVACFDVIGEWKELRAHRQIQNFWNTYPEEGKWVTGSVTVDTGAAGDVDQRAAEAAWRAKYGNKNRYRARAECVRALKRAVKEITGQDLKKPAEFREWCSKNRAALNKAKHKRD
jgi:hypothetical protein